ncbi:MAG: MarR family transcriptional regulator [Chthoniobacteraceae bacterium]
MLLTRDEVEMRADAERLAEIITNFQRCFLLNVSKELARGQVSFAQYLLLGFLYNNRALTMTEIASKMGHTTAAATGLVDRLENLGHVRRMHSSDDRRKIEVSITPSGEKLVEKVRADMVENLVVVMGELSVEEQKSWLQIYEKLFQICQRK